MEPKFDRIRLWNVGLYFSLFFLVFFFLSLLFSLATPDSMFIYGIWLAGRSLRGEMSSLQ